MSPIIIDGTDNLRLSANPLSSIDGIDSFNWRLCWFYVCVAYVMCVAYVWRMCVPCVMCVVHVMCVAYVWRMWCVWCMWSNPLTLQTITVEDAPSKDLNCQICGKVFKRRPYLLQHLSRVHHTVLHPEVHTSHIRHTYATHTPHIHHTYATHTPHIRHTYTTHTPHIRHTYATHMPYATHTPHKWQIRHICKVAKIHCFNLAKIHCFNLAKIHCLTPPPLSSCPMSRYSPPLYISVRCAIVTSPTCSATKGTYWGNIGSKLRISSMKLKR